PLVEKELIQTAMTLCECLRNVWCADVEHPGCNQTDQHCDERRQLNPQRNMMIMFQDFIARSRVKRALPELCIFVAEEVLLEHKTCKQSANSKKHQRNEHHWWRFMSMMHDFSRSAGLAIESHENQTP